jgi:signal transduction histidine kinase
LVAVPLAALLSLWVFATMLATGPAFRLLSARTLQDTVADPGEALVAELQRERRLSVEFLSTPDSSLSALAAQRAVTDRAIANFRRGAAAVDGQDAATTTVRARIRQAGSEFDELAGDRGHIDRREVGPVGAQRRYDTVIDTGFQMLSATTTFGDEELDREGRALITVGRGQEYLNRADSLLAGANAAGRLAEDVRVELIGVIATARFLLSDGVSVLPAPDRAAYQRLADGTAFRELRRLEDTLVVQSRAGAVAPVPSTTWQPAYDTSAQQLRAFQLNATEALAARARPIAVEKLVRLGVAGAVGLVALILSIVAAVRVGRSIVGRLARLRGEATEIANERVPAVVGRLRRGEPVDVNVETPPPEYGRDEIGQVGLAINEVERTAMRSAVEEAGIRRGINEVFLNIARRSQTLLHRQLALLDRMERRDTGPEELEDLYQVDHLATRMRRHAEDLVILAGAAPGRGWRNPVPVVDVVRGAISEVEDYKRVDIRSVEPSAVLGRAVGDVIHLLAELLENAATFSPPHTRVEVTGQVLPSGYAIEVEDRGFGMSPDAIEEANRKLAEPPDFDPANSARLGLFVVAQLANRHGIRTQLRSSVFGGITAILLLPGDLVTVNAAPATLPTGPAPADRLWERPLVGSGTDDPSRQSLAALQWQGTEQLRSVTVPGRPVTVNGVGPAPSDAIPRQHSGVAQPSSAMPSSTADGLPRRIRQASLAPQLRAPLEKPVATASPRTPEQARTLLTALQQGTERGRRAARGIETDPESSGTDAVAEAATVVFPVVQDRAKPEDKDA